jgi:non-ribosomal peptide synthase protein (TIGR01720 family)
MGRFTYMGRLTATPPPHHDKQTNWHQIGLGGDATERMPAAHALEAGGIVQDGPAGPELSLSLSWPGDLFDEARVRALVDGWVAMLTGFAEHAARPAAGGHTPSDFPLLDLGQEQVDELEAMAAEIEKGMSA